MNIDIDKIKKMTNEKIGYANFQEERQKRKKKDKCVLFISGLLFLIIITSLSVNAATNNGILNLVKKLIKVNGESKNAYIYDDYNIVSYDESENQISDHAKCIKYYPYKNTEDNESTICFPENTEFQSIEIFYDDNNYYSGFHITGYTDGEYFDYSTTN
jgi:hypothetical protein